MLEWGVLSHCLGSICISKVVYEKSKVDTRAFEAYKATHSIRAASLLPILKNTEILCQVLYWKLACPSASSYPPKLSLVTAVKMISLCSIIFRWQSWTINRVLLSSGAFTKCDVQPADGPEDGAGTIPFCRMVYAWSTTVRVYLAVLLVPMSHTAMEQCCGKHGPLSGACRVCPLQPHSDDLCRKKVMEFWDLVSLCVCKALVMICSILPCFIEEPCSLEYCTLKFVILCCAWLLGSSCLGSLPEGRTNYIKMNPQTLRVSAWHQVKMFLRDILQVQIFWLLAVKASDFKGFPCQGEYVCILT